MPPETPQTVHLLVIERDSAAGPRLRQLVERVVDRRFRIVHEFSTVAAAAPALERESVDLVLAEIGGDGLLEMEQLVRVPTVGGYVPFLVVDDELRENVAQRALEAGAQDYVVKPGLSPEQLAQAMRWAVERFRAERDLKKESDLLRALLEAVPDAIYFKDRHSRILRASASVTNWLRVPSPAEAIGKTDFHFLPPEYAEATFAEEQRVIESGQPIVNKLERQERPDGSVRWSSTTKLPLRDRFQRIIGTCGITRDVTDLKQLEETLAAERNRLRGVLDNLPDPIYVKDTEGRYVLDNKAHARFLGVESEQDVIGKTVFDFFERSFAEQAHEVDMTVLREGKPWVNHEESTSSTGEATWLVTSKVPLHDENGHIVGLVCINRDITAEKRAKLDLEEANEHLTRALSDLKNAHKELHSVQLQLIEAEKLKSIGRLAAGVAHEVKNPLAIVSMGIEFLHGKYGEDATTASVLKDLADAVQRADTVIKGMLDFSAPRQLELAPCDLNGIIRAAITLVRGEVKPELHRVELDLGELPPVEADRVKVSQVFVNLFTNALQAMPEGGTLSVRSRVVQLTGVGANIGGELSQIFHAGDYVVIVEVADTGTGVPPEALPHIFDPFFTTKPTGKGTGLGMSVVRSIMNLQRGAITMRNREHGPGAVATLTFKAQNP
jgi:PAS domain S-box-containing protein